jgi:hypothetical protein
MPNNLTAFTPQVWSQRVIQKLYQTNVAMAIVANTDYEGELQAAGDTVWVRTYGRVTMQPYAKNQTISYESLVPTKESLQVNDSQFFAFKIDDIDARQADLSVIDGYAREAAISFNELIDTKVFTSYSSALTANKMTSAGSPYVLSATNLYGLIVDANTNLDVANAPQEGRWMILSPNAKGWIAKSTDIVKGLSTADRIISTGRPGMMASQAPNYLGVIDNMDLFWSNNLPADGGGKYIVYGQGKPISYVSQLSEVEKLRLESTFSWAMRGLILHDTKVFAEHSKRLGSIYVTL